MMTNNKKLLILFATAFVASLVLNSAAPAVNNNVGATGNMITSERGRVWVWINKQADGKYVNQFQQVTSTQAQYYLSYIAAHGWGINIEVPLDGLQTDAGAQSVLALMNYIDTNSGGKIPMWLQIEQCLWKDNGWTQASTVSDYEALLGAHFRLIDTTAPHLVGWGWENGYDNGVAWLRSATSRPLTQYWVHPNIQPTSSMYLGGQNGLAWRFKQTQAAVVEVYMPNELNDTVPLIKYIQAQNSSMPIGITTQWDSKAFWSANQWMYWFGTPDVATQKEIIKANIKAFTDQTGKHFDFLEYIWKNDSPPDVIDDLFD